MRYLVLENNIVTNVIDASEEFIIESKIHALQSDFEGGIGDTYLDGSFLKPRTIEVFTPVKPMYLRIALMKAGLLDTIEANLTGANKIAFEYALEFDRYDPMIMDVAEAFNLSNNQVDELFILAMGLQN